MVRERASVRFRTVDIDLFVKKLREWVDGVKQGSFDRLVMHYRNGYFGLYAYKQEISIEQKLRNKLQQDKQLGILKDTILVVDSLNKKIEDIKIRLKNMELI